MAAPRKVFRIEEMAAPQRPAQIDEAQEQLPGLAEIMRETSARAQPGLAAIPTTRPE